MRRLFRVPLAGALLVATAAVGAAAVVATAAGAAEWVVKPPAKAAAASTPAVRNGRVLQRWENGTIRSDITYRDDTYEGEYRTWYASGRPFELRHYVDGHEQGLQQSWTDAGELYLNYEVRDGRRFGLVNATPCNEVGGTSATGESATAAGRVSGSAEAGEAGRAVTDAAEMADASGLPYYDDATFTPRWTPVAHRIASFAMAAQDGRGVSDATLRGRPYVASFIYTQCAAVCPILVRHLLRVQDAARRRDARILSFSVTPETDTPATLAAFGRERGIDAATWSLVTGDRRTIYTLARTSFFADDSRVGASPEDLAFLHTEKLLLVDGDGHLRGIYNGTQPHAIDQLIADLDRLARPPVPGANGG